MTTLESPTRRPAQGRRPGRGNAAGCEEHADVTGAGGSDLGTADRIGAGSLVGGCLLMAAGAIIQSTSGADLFAVMDASDPAEITAGLIEVAEARTQMVTGLSLWVAGVPAICLGIVLLSRRTVTSGWSAVARWAAGASTGAAIVFFAAMIGIAVGLAPAAVAGEDVASVTRAMGVAASAADWVTTALVLFGGIGSVVLSARGGWAPRWLVGLAIATGVAAAVSLSAFVAGSALAIIVVPVGLALGIATGIAALRTASSTMIGIGARS